MRHLLFFLLFFYNLYCYAVRVIMAKPCACIFNYSVSDLHLLEYNGFDQEMWELNRKVRQFKYFTDGAVQRHSCPWQLSAY